MRLPASLSLVPACSSCVFVNVSARLQRRTDAKNRVLCVACQRKCEHNRHPQRAFVVWDSFCQKRGLGMTKMLLIPGRSRNQGTALNAGKLGEKYLDVTSTLEMNELDMQKLGIEKGGKVRLSSSVGEVVVSCVPRKDADLPSGLLFIAYGPTSSELMSSDTAGSGMPLSKHLEVKVERCDGADIGE